MLSTSNLSTSFRMTCRHSSICLRANAEGDLGCARKAYERSSPSTIAGTALCVDNCLKPEFFCNRKRIRRGELWAADGLISYMFMLCSHVLFKRGRRRSRRSKAEQGAVPDNWHRVGAPGGAGPYVIGPARPIAATPGNRGPAVARGGPRIWVRQPAAIRRWRLSALCPCLR
jgi:hypothetical protein